MMYGSPYTLVEAKDKLREALMAGKIVDCPCCKQRCKVYKRKLNATMARGLIWLVRRSTPARAWVNIQEGPAWLLRTKELPTTSHWGLIEKRANRDASKGSSGVWRPTERGIAFVQGELKVPSHIHLYNNMLVDESGLTTIYRALGKKFNYAELMQEHGLA